MSLDEDLSGTLESSEDASGSSSPALPPAHDNLDVPASEEIIVPPSPPVVGDRDVQEEAILHARGYQMEMLEESLKQNIIVAMDTGSGKTQIAILRIQAELGKSSPGKLIWFLTPTVELCLQQYKVVQSQIPSVLAKVLSGSKQPETWSTQQVWEAFLENVSIIVSTPQVLCDALLHRFLRMERFSLIVFDEAHNCVGRNPGSKVMDFYHRTKRDNLHVPAILGLTASPVMNTARDSLEIIEKTLDAVCRTPTIHRGELLAQVNRPVTMCVSYEPAPERGTVTGTRAMESLQHARNSLDIRLDPYVQRKLLENTERSILKLKEAVQQNDTPSTRQMNSLCRKSAEIYKELGAWAVDCFIRAAITQYLDAVGKNDVMYAAWDLAEKKYLADTLRSVQLPGVLSTSDISATDKIAKLIEQLQICPTNALGIVFVKETATVNILYRLLSSHPKTRHRFRIGTMVGSSSHASRKKDIGEMNRGDSLDLERFRSGMIDLLIATNVLEEGIDIPACNLVICFDKPSNLKSFIQRRGRARMKDSRLVLLCETGDGTQNMWEGLEEDMKKKYEDENRQKRKFNELEESTDSYSPSFSTSTGNTMDIDQAVSHLEHFCATLYSKQFVECRPYYLFERTYTTRMKSEPPLIKATVVLPNSLPGYLRRTHGACTWYSEKKACKDAAFEAYQKLYGAGLVNENLLPFKEEELVQGPDSRLSEEEVSGRWNPWPRVARAWSGSQEYRHTVRLSDDDRTLCHFDMSIPILLPNIPPFKVFWDERPWTLGIDSVSESTNTPHHDAEETMALISLALGHRRLEVRKDGQHVVQFHSTADSPGENRKITINQRGSHTFSLASHGGGHLPYLIRNTVDGAPYFFDTWLPSQPRDDLLQKKLNNFYWRFLEDSGIEGPWLALRNWPRRRDFLHEVRKNPVVQKPSEKPYMIVWPASCCRVDSTPIINVQFGSLIPSITHMIEIYLVVQELSETVLKELSFQDLSLLVTAVSASSAREATDYQRLEFLGDVLLKLLSTVSVAVNHPQFPEGYLSKMRARMVSNSRLCRSTKDASIDQFILTKEFTGDKWQPLYVDELATVEELPGTRRMSTKVLADIIESLTGASFQDGGQGKSGMHRALQCLRLLIPDNEWHSLDDSRHALLSLKESNSDLPPSLTSLEGLLGYTFINKTLLLEALTHGSYNLGSSNDRSYERLEFIGDAILDYIIVLKLWERNLPQSMMSPLRAACVNADLLGFLGMEWTVPRGTSEVVDGQPVSSTVEFPFWKFMRHSSADISAVQKDTEQRHALERGPILDAIKNGPTYPWALLAHLHIPKFFSDIFESIMGAVWLDSGDLGQCQAIVERIQISAYLDRMLDEGVDIFHPKNKLGEMAEQKTVRYEVGRQDDPPQQLTCKVYVGDELIVEVGEGLHKDEVITKAAERACVVLRSRKKKKKGDQSDVMDIDG